MRNRLLAFALVGTMVGLGSASWAADTVFHRGKDKDGKDAEIRLDGKIEDESPAGIKLKLKGKSGGERLIPASEIMRVWYDTPAVAVLDFRKSFPAEDRASSADKDFMAAKTEAARDKARARRDKEMAAAMKGFRELDGKLNGPARRYMQYKIAYLLAWQARDDADKVPEAITALEAFKTEHAGGWEIVDALQRLGKLQEKVGKLDAARKTYEDLAAIPEVPQQVKLAADFLVARLYLRARKFPEAEAKLAVVEKAMAASDPDRAFIVAYRADSQMGQGNLKTVEKQLRGALAMSADNKLRALAYNLLGDYYLRQNQREDAFWQYLRVDVLYPQDPEEHAKALYNLATLFDKVKNDPLRAEDCANRLRERAPALYERLQKEKK